jgi:hypothetical protein
VTEPSPKKARPRDAAFWATSRNVLRVSEVPSGAVNLNVEGRRAAGALQGFGQLWQKTHRLRLTGVKATPAEVVEVWKREFPSFHPPESRFYPSLDGVAPGEIQWPRITNIWHNAGLRSMIFMAFDAATRIRASIRRGKGER